MAFLSSLRVMLTGEGLPSVLVETSVESDRVERVFEMVLKRPVVLIDGEMVVSGE